MNSDILKKHRRILICSLQIIIIGSIIAAIAAHVIGNLNKEDAYIIRNNMMFPCKETVNVSLDGGMRLWLPDRHWQLQAHNAANNEYRIIILDDNQQPLASIKINIDNSSFPPDAVNTPGQDQLTRRQLDDLLQWFIEEQRSMTRHGQKIGWRYFGYSYINNCPALYALASLHDQGTGNAADSIYKAILLIGRHENYMVEMEFPAVARETTEYMLNSILGSIAF